MYKVEFSVTRQMAADEGSVGIVVDCCVLVAFIVKVVLLLVVAVFNVVLLVAAVLGLEKSSLLSLPFKSKLGEVAALVGSNVDDDDDDDDDDVQRV